VSRTSMRIGPLLRSAPPLAMPSLLFAVRSWVTPPPVWSSKVQ